MIYQIKNLECLNINTVVFHNVRVPENLLSRKQEISRTGGGGFSSSPKTSQRSECSHSSQSPQGTYLTNKDTGCPGEFEFQTHKKFCLRSPEKLLFCFLTFKVSGCPWVPYPGTSDTRVENHPSETKKACGFCSFTASSEMVAKPGAGRGSSVVQGSFF